MSAIALETGIESFSFVCPLFKFSGESRNSCHRDHFAAVYVNDHFMGHVDEFSNFAQTLALPSGTYDVKIVPVNGQGTVTKTVTLEADKTVIVK